MPLSPNTIVSLLLALSFILGVIGICIFTHLGEVDGGLALVCIGFGVCILTGIYMLVARKALMTPSWHMWLNVFLFLCALISTVIELDLSIRLYNVIKIITQLPQGANSQLSSYNA